ncbi:MAG: hypothetical protein VR72_14045 [Clostridiaceae bacterium BRH_c20a]|nr:MAG: hypothetical protein VR72_14045 [Clostridiaceae bacterium BRH_c20a]
MGTPLEKNKKYSYKDYLNWDGEERWELIDGEPILMTPSPSRLHQKILGFIFNHLYNYLQDKNCEVYSAPFDVRFAEESVNLEEIDTVVQPDISVICDKNKLDDRGCKGAPDLIIEIVSPTSVSTDYIKKLNLYCKYKVKEYWIVDPKEKTVMVYKLLADNDYGKPKIYNAEETIKVNVFPNLTINLWEIFKD